MGSLLSLLLPLISIAFPAELFYGETRFLWNIPITVLVYSEKDAQRLVNGAFSEVRRSGDKLNRYSKESEISEINRNAGKKPVEVSEETFRVIRRAITLSKRTEGAFDVTVAPLISLWDFRKGKVPSPEDVREVLPLVGFEKIEIDEGRRTVFLREKGMEIDLGGLIKGYLVDVAVAYLKRKGAIAGLVSLGGDIRVFGNRPGEKEWKIGVKHPRRKGVIAVIEIREGAISTSGDYERYFISGGKRYHHIIDPRTGYPARGFQSVTVLAKEGIVADALSTALFVLGPEKAKKKAEELGIEALFIDSDGKVYSTEGLRDRITFLNP